jgi:subtilisin family serine protease
LRFDSLIGINNQVFTADGTSLSSPQVAGLAALLGNRNTTLLVWPEAIRAILMASATHNIDGPPVIISGQGDLQDGAGAINADLADQVAQSHGISGSPCTSSCWWGESISNQNYPVGTFLERTITIPTKGLVRVAISWWSNADSANNNYSFDRLDTDLDLKIAGPDSQWIPGASSVSYDNNFEMVQFFAPVPGNYGINVYKSRADENVNYLGIAAAIIPMPRTIYLPIISRDQ